MTNLDIVGQRLQNQRLTGTPFKNPEDVVRWMGAVQAQDYLGALWSVGLRMQEATEATVERAVAEGRIVRTWPMRGTLHFVAPEDVRWMLKLLAPRVIAKFASYYRKTGLDRRTFARSKDLLARALRGGKHLTRKQLYEVLEQAGISTGDMRGLFILGYLAMEGFLIFGTRRGKQHTFTLLEKWVPPAKNLGREQSLANLTRRFFASHGPATLQDLMWWSGLTTAEVKAGLEMVKSEFRHEDIGGKTYGFSPPVSPSAKTGPTAYLLPAYDEYLIAYKDRSAAFDSTTSTLPAFANGFYSTIVIDGRVVGTWRRTLKSKTVIIETRFFAPLDRTETRALNAAAERYSRFLNVPVRLSGLEP